MAPSSSGLGRRPLKAKVAGSNPVGATKSIRAGSLASGSFVIGLPAPAKREAGDRSLGGCNTAQGSSRCPFAFDFARLAPVLERFA